MVQVTHYLPELEEPERTYIQCLVGRMTSEQIPMFSNAYRQRRKHPQTVLLASIIGLIACPGFQRFWLGHMSIGFLHLFTCGLLLVGSISDLVRYKTLALLYNQRAAREIAAKMRPRFAEQQRGRAKLRVLDHSSESNDAADVCPSCPPKETNLA